MIGDSSGKVGEVLMRTLWLALAWGMCVLGTVAAEPPLPEDAPTIKVEVTGVLAVEKIEFFARPDPEQPARKVKQTILRIKGLDDYTFAVAPELVERAEKLANKKVVLTCTTLFALPPMSHGIGTFPGPGPGSFAPSQVQRVQFSLFVAEIREAEKK
jgi:hypothetical protein